MTPRVLLPVIWVVLLAATTATCGSVREDPPEKDYSEDSVGQHQWFVRGRGGSHARAKSVLYHRSGQLCGIGNYDVADLEIEMVDLGDSVSTSTFGSFGSASRRTSMVFFIASGLVTCRDPPRPPPSLDEGPNRERRGD